MAESRKPGPETDSKDADRREFERRRRNRNLALLGVLVGLVVLFYVLSIVRLAVE